MLNQSKKRKQLNEIFKKTQVHLKKIAYHFFQDHDIADDVVQKVYIRIYKKLPIKFDHEVDSLKWCSVICKNLCIDYYRKKIRNRKLIDKISQDFLASSEDETHAEDSLTNHMLREIVEKILSQMGAVERMIYTMDAYFTFSTREIAVISNHSVNHVRSVVLNMSLCRN